MEKRKIVSIPRARINAPDVLKRVDAFLSGISIPVDFRSPLASRFIPVPFDIRPFFFD